MCDSLLIDMYNKEDPFSSVEEPSGTSADHDKDGDNICNAKEAVQYEITTLQKHVQ